MNPYRWWRRGAARRARQVFLLVVVVSAAVAVAVALVPRGISAADTPAPGASQSGGISAAGAPAPASPAPAASPAVPPNDGGVTWKPDGTPAQSNNGSGGCEVAMSGTVTGPGAPVVAQVDSALEDEKPDPIGQDGIGSLSLSVPQGTSGTSMTVYSDAGVDCSAVNQVDAYIRRAGYASPVQFARALLGARDRPAGPGSPRGAALLAYDLPTWLRVAIGAAVGAVVFAAVIVEVTAVLIALLAATNAVIVPEVLAVVSGCIAGLAAGPLTMAIATFGHVTVTSSLASALAGCFAGIAVSAALGLKWIAAVFQQLGWAEGSVITAMVGQGIEANAAAAGVSLGPVETELSNIVAAAGGSG